MNSRDTEKTAVRFGVTTEKVEEATTQVEEEKAIELELRTIKRDGELIEFLRYTYDQESIANKCEWAGCDKGPWKYYDELIAHVRTHLILSGDRQANNAMNAVDKLIAPTQEVAAKVTLPQGESSEKLLDRLAEGLVRRLTPRPEPDVSSEQSVLRSGDDESIDIEATVVPPPDSTPSTTDNDPDDS